MLANHTQRSLETAAAKTMERIRSDRGRVVRRLQPLLQHIEDHLFDPGLDVNQLKRSCGVRDNSVPIQFHAQLGLPPHAYIEECRLRTGCRLLRDTELKIWQIADLLGYSSIQVFSRAFSRWAGMRPTGFRRKARREGIAIPSRILEAANANVATASVQSVHGQGVPKNGARQNGTKAQHAAAVISAQGNGQAAGNGQAKAKGLPIEVENLRRALDGELEAAAADQLIRRLLNLYPTHGAVAQGTPVAAGLVPWQSSSATRGANGRGSSRRGTNGYATNGHATNRQSANGHGKGTNRVEPTLMAIAAGAVGGLLDTEQVETVRAEEVWKRIKGERYQAQVAAVQHEYRFRTPALFHHLCQRSLVDGRDNRKRGVGVAELALVALETVRVYVTSEKEFSILQGKGYTWLGNARRLAVDFVGAEKMLALAAELLHGESGLAPQECAQLHLNTAALRWNQRRFEESATLCDEALALFERNGGPVEVARVLLLRANVHFHLDRDAQAAIDYRRAIRLLEKSTDRFLLATSYQGFLSVLVRSGRIRESLPFLDKARELSRELSSRALPSYLEWFEGLIEQARGQIGLAEYKIRAARRGFLDIEEDATAALVSLDLAILYHEAGRLEEVIEISSQLVPHFKARQAHGELLVIVGVLQRAVAAKTVSSQLLKRLRSEASKPV